MDDMTEESTSISLRENMTEDSKLASLQAMNLPPVWLAVFDDYKIKNQIGQGSFGVVVGAKCKATGQKVAIKHVSNFRGYDYDCCKLIREIKIMQSVGELLPE